MMRRSGSFVAALLFSSVHLLGCESPAALGAPCTRASECGAPLTCAFGRCRTECVLNRDCPVGTICLLDEDDRGSCAIEDDPGCGPSAQCSGGLLCVDRACVNGCTTVAECPSDSECIAASDGRTRCVRTDGADASVDGGIEDAAIDASEGDAGPACVVGPPCDPIVQLGVGAEHVCVRATSGAVWCWGVAESGQLGQQAPTTGCLDGRHCSPVPMRVPYVGTSGDGPITTAIDLAVSSYNACAVVHDDTRDDVGEVVCWGSSSGGTLGDATSDGVPAQRVRLDDGSAYLDRDATEVALAESFAISHHASGREYGWGHDDRGELRIDGTVHAGALEVETVPGHLGLTTGWSHGCTRVRDDATGTNEAWCWGANGTGQCGGTPPFTADTMQSPIAITGLGSVRSVEPGRAHTCALTEDGNVWCWGNADLDGRIEASGEPRCSLGADRYACPPGTVFRPGPRPFAVLGTTTTNAECAIDEAGAVWCWGEYSAPIEMATGQPSRIGDVEGATAVAIGASVACLLTHDGDVWCWGANYHGQLGRGSTEAFDVLEPGPVAWPTQ